ncbi:lytic transglycosylase domain-containing protein [Tsuneonella troitsensis]|jgi:soluble lytic murein transglycosylase-like protein|uniref:lytic transglycosylase domain-containing protein n=1 Tax=Tsuneonella troitsensis TaxID=292222 RepID=UPI00070AF06D|nr:lytic transglycosylase domain-containing protein [Tsuneonella troitsensis]OGS51795.1 MAG: transglycosylase [Erythrobacter sp. RIFCSPHIGHO2_12_FULL_63_10]
MILAKAGTFAAFALFCAAAPVRADVLEIGPAGPRWIAGALAVAAADPAAPEQDAAALVELSGDHVVPPHAIADAAAHAGMVPALYAAKVAELAGRFDLSPALIEAMVWQESRWNASARSPVGARGLAQLMPGTARYLGVDPDDPFANLEGGARYLREQMDRFDGNIEKALAAYNAGPGRVIAAGGIPRIRETQGYVAAIMGRLSDHSRKPN